MRPVVRIEAGAKSALDPNQPTLVRPYVADEAAELDLAVPGVTTIEAGRTFWDKVVILEGQRVSRHYYDLHCLAASEAGRAATSDLALGLDCVRHARMFFDRPDYDLASAKPGSFALAPTEGMVEALRRDYASTVGMVFGRTPAFGAVLESIRSIEENVNQRRAS